MDFSFLIPWLKGFRARRWRLHTGEVMPLAGLFGGPLAATLSAALSTVLFLWLSHGQEWGSRFIQLYSLTSMIAGWANAAALQLGPRSIFLRSKGAGLGLFFLALAVLYAAFHIVFKSILGPYELLLCSAVLCPVLYAFTYGGAYSVDRPDWSYKRVVFFNFLLFVAVAVAAIFSQSYQALCLGAGAAALVTLCFFAVDNWLKVDSLPDGADYFATGLNPSVPILERTVWDQWILFKFAMEGFSWPLYLVTRVITFSGNVLFSFLMGRQLAASARPLNPAIVLKFLVPANTIALCAAYLADSTMAYLVFGSLVAWQFSLLLATVYQGGSRVLYRYIALFWLLSLATRLLLVKINLGLQSYSQVQACVTWLLLFLLGLILLRLKNARRAI